MFAGDVTFEVEAWGAATGVEEEPLPKPGWKPVGSSKINESVPAGVDELEDILDGTKPGLFWNES